MKKDSDSLFDKYGLDIKQGEVKVGGTYPIYGMITKFLKEDDAENVEVEVNFQMRMIMNFNGDMSEKLEILKERAFEPGIFITEVISTEETSGEDGKKYGVVGNCTTVVFGRKQVENIV